MLVEEPKPESCVGFLFMCLFVVESANIIGCSLDSMFGVLEEVSLRLSLFMLDIKLVGERLRCIKLVAVII
jgi:hypothetical protein